jgi:ring-1,2-phenylacetyl-CoA epoxidase subunit PaaB
MNEPAANRTGQPLWEVFVRARRGLSRNARDVYTRRGEGVSIWVVPSAAIVANSPDEKDPFFDPALDKVYRHPTFYDVPEGAKHL